MMQVHLYCPDCLAEMSKQGLEKGFENITPILSDVYELLNDGIYTVHCSKGHTSKVVLENLTFELLFDLGINAIGDGYYREAVASITSSLERFYEFFVKTIWRTQGLEFELIDNNWKVMSNQSERQLGAYIGAYSSLFGEEVPLMTDSQRSFRNCVIHKGEIPTREKTVVYAGVILGLIDSALEKLHTRFSEVTKETFDHYAPHYDVPKGSDENVLIINHPTIIQAKEALPIDDQRRNRDIDYLVNMVLNDRYPKRIWLHNENDKNRVAEDYDMWLSHRLDCHNDVESTELQEVLDPCASTEECLDMLGEQLAGYNYIIGSLYEVHPELFSNDMMIAYLGNVQLKSQLYYQYLRVKVYQQLLNNNPDNNDIKVQYEREEQALQEFYNHLSAND